MLPKSCYWLRLSIDDDAYKTGTQRETKWTSSAFSGVLDKSSISSRTGQSRVVCLPPIRTNGDGKSVGTLISHLRVCAWFVALGFYWRVF